jgi:hypothetical protein
MWGDAAREAHKPLCAWRQTLCIPSTAPRSGHSPLLKRKSAHSSWVSARRGSYPVSSRSPLRTGRATLMASGSAPLILLHGGTMKRRFPFLQFHRYPPVDSLRVHWVPLFPSSQRLGAFAVSSRPGVPSFPGFRLLCPIRLFLWPRGFVGVSLTYSPLPFASSRKSPVFIMKDSNGML